MSKNDIADILKLEIMQYNYWEHYKFEKDISMALPLDNPKRIMMRKATQDLLTEIHALSNDINKQT